MELPDNFDEEAASADFQRRRQEFRITREEADRMHVLADEFYETVLKEFGPRTNSVMCEQLAWMLACAISKATVEESRVIASVVNIHFAQALLDNGGPPVSLQLDPGLENIINRVRAEKETWDAATPPAKAS